jgi:uncharacterized protein (TIGR02001 family)
VSSSARAESPDDRLGLAANVALATEYVFRGFSQTAENPAIQGGFDVTYGIGYLGVWASNLDFGSSGPGAGAADVANIEMDWLAGLRPEWGRVALDFGLMYYTYPGADDDAELDYLEWKVGASGSAEKLDLGITAYYTEEYTARSGAVWTVEGDFALRLPEIWRTTPRITGIVGTSVADSATAFTAFGNGEDSYAYWSLGVIVGFMDRFDLDLRYWDTDVDGPGPAVSRKPQIRFLPDPPTTPFCSSSLFQCDERFVAMLSASF